MMAENLSLSSKNIGNLNENQHKIILDQWKFSFLHDLWGWEIDITCLQNTTFIILNYSNLLPDPPRQSTHLKVGRMDEDSQTWLQYHLVPVLHNAVVRYTSRPGERGTVRRTWQGYYSG